ncbi:MAG: hypothetical protein J5490_07140 [Bacteroidales bacterium]|nr:hypothetical protein [Bacteroidales bacterium]
MTINYFTRGQSSKLSKLYVRLRDGRSTDQTGSTNIIVLPAAWNSKLELLNASKCPEELDWESVNDAISALRKHLTRKFINDSLTTRVGPRWLRDALEEYFGNRGSYTFNAAFDKFLHVHELSDSRISQYEVLRRLVLRFLLWKKGRADSAYARDTDLRFFDTNLLIDLWEFTEKEYLIYKEHPEFFQAFPDKREPPPGAATGRVRVPVLRWLPRGRPPQFQENRRDRRSAAVHPAQDHSQEPQDHSHPLNETARTIAARYASSPTDKLLPFISTQKYNEAIKEICEKVGVDRMVTVLDPLTRTERKVRICDIASSHMARRTFAGNLYKKVKERLPQHRRRYKEGTGGYEKNYCLLFVVIHPAPTPSETALFLLKFS